MDTKMKAPETRKAKVMLWTDVSYHDMEEIDKRKSFPDLERSPPSHKHIYVVMYNHTPLTYFRVTLVLLCDSVLCSVFGVDLPEPKRGVLLELYVQTVLFCRERRFKKEQTSALLSIIKSIHEANVETPVNNIEYCFKYCKELLLCHSVRRPPFSINLFSSEEVNCILEYIHKSYVRHYKLYKYIFTPQAKLDLSLTYSGIPDQDEPTKQESSSPDAENVMEKEAKAVPKTDGSPQTQETSDVEPEGSTFGSKSELKALIEKEVREQMMFMSGQLDQQMKEIADQHNRALESPQLHHKAKQ